MEDNKRVKLSKAILDMKFMKRTKERVRKEEENTEGQEMYSSEITNEMRHDNNIKFVETSVANCKNLIEGRLSFGGMNPETERIMLRDYYKKCEEVDLSKEKEVTDIEMAKGYSLAETMGKKFQDKRRSNSKRRSTKTENN